MPSVASKNPSLESLTSKFPLTFPVPTPTSHADLISPNDLHREEDLLRNPSSFRAWWTAINNTREAFNALQKTERASEVPDEVTALLGPLATPLSRQSLQRLTYIYEAALVQFPGSFKLWKSYLTMRMSYVLGRLVVKKRSGGKKKFPEMKDALEEERGELEQWEGGLDGVVGWEEWKSLVATFERALMWLPNVRPNWNHIIEGFTDAFHSCPDYGLCIYPYSTTHSVHPSSLTLTLAAPMTVLCVLFLLLFTRVYGSATSSGQNPEVV